jgi:hypothetical protein
MKLDRFSLLNKKILVISSWAPPKIGGPQNFYYLFSELNPRDFYIITKKQNLPSDNKKLGYKLDCDYFFYNNITNNIILEQDLPKKRHYYILKKIPPLFSFTKSSMLLVKLVVGSIPNLFRIIKISKSIIKKNDNIVIMGLSDGEINLISALIVAKITKKPLVIFLFDLYKGNKLNFPFNILANLSEKLIFKSAQKIIVTNHTTKDYYINKYGMIDKFSVIYNSVSDQSYKYKEKTGINNKDIIKMVYTGNIYWPQETALSNLLTLIKKKVIKSVKIEIYCPNVPKNLLEKFGNVNTITFSQANQSEMPKIQSEADILFLPFSFDAPAKDIIKTASPAKLTDYLIAGKPILIHAPNYSFVAKYAKENSFAEVIDKEYPELLILAIKKLTEDEDYVNKLVNNAKKVFYQNHDALNNSIKLQEIINNL